MGAKISTGGSSKRGGYDTNAEMNVIPFIDILLVLLIIFMVAAPPPTTDVRVDLPPPNAEPQASTDKPTMVFVRDAGGGQVQIFVDTEEATEETLVEIVTRHARMNSPGEPNPLLAAISIRADQTLPYKSVMGAMGVLQGGLFQKVSLLAETAIDESLVAN